MLTTILTSLNKSSALTGLLHKKSISITIKIICRFTTWHLPAFSWLSDSLQLWRIFVLSRCSFLKIAHMWSMQFWTIFSIGWFPIMCLIFYSPILNCRWYRMVEYLAESRRTSSAARLWLDWLTIYYIIQFKVIRKCLRMDVHMKIYNQSKILHAIRSVATEGSSWSGILEWNAEMGFGPDLFLSALFLVSALTYQSF